MSREKRPSRLKEFERYADGRHHFIAASMVLSGISALLSVVPFYYIWLIIREALADPALSNSDQMVAWGLTALVAALASLLIYISGLMLSHFAAFRISKNLKKAMIRHVMSLPPNALDEEGSGRVRRTIQDSVQATHEYLAHNQPDLAATYTLPFAIIALLLVFDWRLGLASLIPVLLGIWASMSMMGKGAMQESMQQWQDSMADVNNKAVEYIRGISVIKAFQQTVDSFQSLEDSIDRYTKFCQDYTEMARGPMTRFFSLINGCVAFIIAAAVLIIDYLDDGVVSTDLVANVIFYVMFTPLITVLLMRIMFTSNSTYVVDDALNRIHELLSMQPLEEPTDPKMPDEYTVRFHNVRFTYSGGTSPAVDGVDLVLRQGAITALVGPSGSGKSTMAGLAARFWAPQEGSVTIGGIDITDIGSRNVRRIESYVFQSSHLIKGTLLDNLKLGNPDVPDERVREALSLAQCDDILEKLPDGLGTPIGPGGTYLSGGEVQRIAIARALLRDTPIIIMDEATAFADPENEHLIQKGLNELAKGRTVLLIAHRLTTVRNADLICVMDHGKIVESGTHEDLVASSRRYRSMWDDYQRALAWKVTGARS